METIRKWIKLLNYPEGSEKWVRPYFSTMSNLDKDITAEVFKIDGDINTKCIILVVTDAYGMGINNPNIKLVIQWDLCMSFDSMIQQMGRARRKASQLAVFILMIAKWTQVKDEKEIQDRIAKRTDAANASSLLSDSNRPKSKVVRPSPLSCKTNASDLSDSGSVMGSDIDDNFEDPATSQLFALFTTDAEEETQTKKTKKRTSASDAEKRVKLPDEIFNYIHITKCQNSFSLDWYDDNTYAPSKEGLIKSLPKLCCNGSSCQSPNPDYFHCTPFIGSTILKYKEADREWITFRNEELKKWRTRKSIPFWSDQEVEKEMPDSLLMPDACLLALAKHGDTFQDESQVHQFLQPWYGIDKYANEIFACLRQSSPQGDPIPTKAD